MTFDRFTNSIHETHRMARLNTNISFIVHETVTGYREGKKTTTMFRSRVMQVGESSMTSVGHKFQKLIFLHLFTELFLKDFS